MEEVATVGRAEGANLLVELRGQLRRYFVKNAGSHTTSIMLDRHAEVSTEWRERNHGVVDRANLHGIDVPLNQVAATRMRLDEPQ